MSTIKIVVVVVVVLDTRLVSSCHAVCFPEQITPVYRRQVII